MLAFFQTLFRDCVGTLLLCLWLKRTKTTHRFRLDQLEDAVLEATAQSTATDVYFNVGLQSTDLGPSKRGTVADISAITAFWFDFDIAGEGHASSQYPRSVEEILKFLQTLPLHPSFLVNSGGGIHGYWPLAHPWVFTDDGDRNQAQELSRFFQGFIIEEGCKLGWQFDNTSDLTRILRPPGTLNHKTSPPKTVEIIHMGDKRYSIEDFEVMTLKAVSEAAAPVPELISTAPVEYPPADADQIVLHCFWMRHCKEDVAVLPEPSWYRMLSVLVRCKDGNRLARTWSQNYPKYSFRGTEEKTRQSLDNAGPATCAHIFQALDGKGYCDHCPFQGFIKSPIQLGNSDELTQAKFTVVAAIKAYADNPGAVFSADNVQALALIEKRDVQAYNSIRAAYVKAGLPVRKIEQFIANLKGMDSESKYEEYNGRMIQLKNTKYGEKAIPLCNFSARITEETTLDDGAEKNIIYKINAKTTDGEDLPEVSIPASEFPAMNWVSAHYGTRAIVEAGQSTKDHLRVAILTLSPEVKRTAAFGHTGWRKVDGQWVYLTSSGAISEEGFDETVSVNLSKSLQAYDLKTPSHSLQDAFLATLRILALAPLKITLLLLCAIFRAPLAELLAVDFTVFIAGRTGSFKSELAALVQGHWGSTFSRLSLPGNWTSTANMLEKLAFWLKDVIFVIDDFLPGHSHLATTELHQKAERLIRGQGNHAGRGRMNTDGTLRPTYSPRGLMVMTGEDVPRGLSLNARLLVIELRKEEINLEILTELQAKNASGLFAATMFFFIKWLAPQMDDLRIFLRQRKDELRDEAVNVAQSHSRTPDLVASLILGLEMFLAFGIDNKAISEEDAAKLREQAWEVLLATDATQGEMQIESDPVERLLSLLKAAFMSGAAHLESIAGGEPSMSNLWGWRETDTNEGAVKAAKPLGKMIGWSDGFNIYLLPDPMWEAVQTLANRQNNPLTTTPITMRKRLAERKLIVVKDGKNVVQKSIRGVKHRVVQMPVTALYEFSQGQPVPQNVPMPVPLMFPMQAREPDSPPFPMGAGQPTSPPFPMESPQPVPLMGTMEDSGVFSSESSQYNSGPLTPDSFMEPFVDDNPFIPDEPKKDI